MRGNSHNTFDRDVYHVLSLTIISLVFVLYACCLWDYWTIENYDITAGISESPISNNWNLIIK